MVQITGVTKGTPCEKKDIEAGDFLLTINGHIIKDVLDYMYYAAERVVELEIETKDRQNIKNIRIHKGEYEDLGLEFSSFLMDKKQNCSNNCIFCFIDQMPKGMRDTLYFKDDDTRLSFLQGNYVTLTNLSESDVERIIKMKLNVNVSVHTTNPELRCKMMNNRFAGEKLKYLWKMAEAGLKLNCQIVLCPGINDGRELERTLTDLEKIGENITSVSIVPVGVTKFRQGLYPMMTFNESTAGSVIDLVDRFQERFLKSFGSRLVFASDEFYLLAKRAVPEAEFYEDYPQYENGVGLLRSLADEFNSALKYAEDLDHERKVTIATGTAPCKFIEGLAKKAMEKYKNLKIEVVPVLNDFFGHTITVSGLLTAQDIIKQLSGKDLGENLLIAKAMLKADEPIFLDDKSIFDVEKALNTKVTPVANDGYELLDAMLGIEEEI